jgi:HEPN domain-containing protein
MTKKLPELWLKYALDDLSSAEALLKAGIFNMACFHSQQVVEKLYKAFIASHEQVIPRTHNLIRLNAICEELNNGNLGVEDEWLLFLNDVYIDSRYPADFGVLPNGQPNKKDALKAFDHAKAIDAIIRPMLTKNHQ